MAPLVIGDGSGTAASVRLLASNQISDTSTVTVNSNSQFQLAGKQERIGPLTLNSGSFGVDIGTGTLTVNGLTTLNGSSVTSSNPFTGSFIPQGNITTIANAISSHIDNVQIDLGGATHAFSVANGSALDDLSVNGNLFNGSFTLSGGGRLRLTGNNSVNGVTSVDLGQTLIVDGTLGDISLNGGFLGGTSANAVTPPGRVGNITSTALGGTAAPGDSPGIINTGSLSFNAATTAQIELNGPVVGTQYDQFNVTGTVSLGNATLQILPGFAPAPGTSFKIINNDFYSSPT